jgi:4'-phosphopantetheinyl transferase
MGPQGKPFLPNSSLRFNLSHASGTALLALGWEHDLGVDIEDASRRLDFANIAARFFAPQERQALEDLPEAEQPAAFFRCWTAKEAYIKALGGGLSIPLDSFTVSLDGEGSPALRSTNTGWQIFRLDAGQGLAAALAARSQVHVLACWRWTETGRALPTQQEPLRALPG